MLAAGSHAQARIIGEGRPLSLLAAVRVVTLAVLMDRVRAAPVLSTSDTLLAYLRADMEYAPAEQVRALFLDGSNRLLRDDLVSIGTVNEAPIYPREIIRRALESNATAIILAHNHPSGNSRPSKGDIELTRRLVDAARLLDIVIHDHVIIGRDEWFSFRASGLM